MLIHAPITSCVVFGTRRSQPRKRRLCLRTTVRAQCGCAVPSIPTSTLPSTGYYAKQLHPKLRLVVLNTLLYSGSHQPDTSAEDDPLQQFVWMTSQLQDARNSRCKVILASHVGPHVGTFNFQSLWVEKVQSPRFPLPPPRAPMRAPPTPVRGPLPLAGVQLRGRHRRTDVCPYPPRLHGGHVHRRPELQQRSAVWGTSGWGA